jgi:hypothetical protein
LTKGATAPNDEVVRDFYANREHFHLDDHFITSIVIDQNLELSHVIIKKLYELHEITDLGFPYKGIVAPSITQMNDLFVILKEPK